MSSVPDPQVVVRARRRTYTAAYKAKVLAELDGCTARGQVGAVLRREGLYSSLVSEWRKQRAAGALDALAPATRGRKAQDPLERENEVLRRENARLAARLGRAETVIDVQKKLCGLLGIDPVTGADTNSL